MEDLADEATERICPRSPRTASAERAAARATSAPTSSAHLRASIATPRCRPRRRPARTCCSSARTPRDARGAYRVTEFVQAFYVGERVLWDAAIELAHDDESQRAVLTFASHLPRYFEVATTHAAEVYLEAQEAARGHRRAHPARSARGPARRARARTRAASRRRSRCRPAPGLGACVDLGDLLRQPRR